jgi:hypothetical protein
VKACETHSHGKYVTFPGGTLVYHISTDDFEHTLCGLLLMHPYRFRNGAIVNCYEGGCPFPDFHQGIPNEEPRRRLCAHCERKQGR